MAQQIKSILFRRDRTWLLAVVSIFALLSVTFTSLITQTQLAYAADNALISMTLLDTGTANGKIDRIQVSIDNDSTNTAAIHDNTGWAVTDGGNAITISSVSFSSAADADPLVINIDLDESDTDLGVDTLNADLEVTYTQQGADAGTEYNDGADTQLLAINTGDAGTEEEIDGAAPVPLAITTIDSDRNGKVDHLQLYFSEAIDDSELTNYAAGADYTPTSLAVANVTGEAIESTEDGNTCPSDTAEDDAYLCIVFTEDANTCSSSDQTGCDTDAVDQDVTWTTGDAGIDIQDASANEAATLLTAGVTEADGAAPVVLSATTDDTDNDGKVDHMELFFTENLDDSAINNYSAGTDYTPTNLALAVVSGEAVEATEGTCDNDAAEDDAYLCISFTEDANTCSSSDQTGCDTDEVDQDVTFDSGSTIGDSSSNYASLVSGGITEADGAQPVMMSVTPASAATGVLRSTNIVMVFSEPMDTTFDEGTEFSVSPDPGTFSEAWTVSDTTVTLTHTNFICGNNTVTTAEATVVDASAAANTLNTSATEDGDWSFGVTGCSSSGSTGTSAALTYEVTINTPNGGEVWDAGSTNTIEWTAGGTGSVDYVNLYYSVDGGTEYTLIEESVINNGSYSWDTPMISTADAALKIELTDLVEVVATDTTDQVFTIDGITTEEPTEAPTTDDQGISPVTGELENISAVEAGDYIRGASFDTIYYIDEDMVRHPFMDAQTYFTWQNSFGSVSQVTDATLSTLTLGSPMLPKPGVVLVKIQSDPKVYALTENPDDMFAPMLRWVTTEDLAIEMYGADWADYVIDVSVTLFNRFERGSDIDDASDITVTKSLMKTREALNS